MRPSFSFTTTVASAPTSSGTFPTSSTADDDFYTCLSAPSLLQSLLLYLPATPAVAASPLPKSTAVGPSPRWGREGVAACWSCATVVVHKKDGLVHKNASVEELRKPTGSDGGRESRCTKSPMEEEKANTLEVSSFDVDERLSFDNKKRYICTDEERVTFGAKEAEDVREGGGG
ncbi:hypothetical protein B296_00004574 [Ensete ventricosum]|uniref:Uncharacterized protein n=1 Tax=Ensete ventricosum TaxID=4639 RepID=A0A427AIW0_ENSVE|nr:hypothetical protein B296_00004574 [Ensete ventricosum]